MNKRPPDHAETIAMLLRAFKLSTMAEELVPRLVQAGQETALPTISEVLAMEEEARHARRVGRLLKASKLPTAKTFETFETFDFGRLGSAVVRNGSRADPHHKDPRPRGRRERDAQVPHRQK